MTRRIKTEVNLYDRSLFDKLKSQEAGMGGKLSIRQLIKARLQEELYDYERTYLGNLLDEIDKNSLSI